MERKGKKSAIGGVAASFERIGVTRMKEGGRGSYYAERTTSKENGSTGATQVLGYLHLRKKPVFCRGGEANRGKRGKERGDDAAPRPITFEKTIERALVTLGTPFADAVRLEENSTEEKKDDHITPPLLSSEKAPYRSLRLFRVEHREG